MSAYSTPSIPASEFGQLALGSDEDMPTLTRAMSRRIAASQASSSPRAEASSSRQQSGRDRAPQQPTRQQPRRGQRRRDEESSDEEDDSDDDDDDDDDENAQNRLRRLQYEVYGIYALSEPRYLVPNEIAGAPGTLGEASRAHRALADLAFASAQRYPEYLGGLRGIADIQSADWARQMNERMRLRQHGIYASLAENVSSPASGTDVRDTAVALRSLVGAIDSLLGRVTEANRRGLLETLLRVLENVVARNFNEYANSAVPRPPYVGQTPNNLYANLVANGNGHEPFAVAVLSRYDPNGQALLPHAARVGQLYLTVRERHTIPSGDGGRTYMGNVSASLQAFINELHAICVSVRANGR